VWTEVRGRLQELDGDSLRDRAGAFPLEIPYRLCNMYSVYGDTVLDPFWGTGTTTLAAMVAGRNSIGYELDETFLDRFEEGLPTVPDLSRTVVEERVADHRAFVEKRRGDGKEFDYAATHYDFPVVTSQEQDIRLYVADEVDTVAEREYRVGYEPADETDIPR
jgi:hypothetical protein